MATLQIWIARSFENFKRSLGVCQGYTETTDIGVDLSKKIKALYQTILLFSGKEIGQITNNDLENINYKDYYQLDVA